MNPPPLTATSATRRVDPKLMDFLRKLKPGDRIRITQTVRVGSRSWPAVAEGVYRDTDFLMTGLSTERVPEDDIVVPLLRFTKPNGELSSVTLDEHSRVERLH